MLDTTIQWVMVAAIVLALLAALLGPFVFFLRKPGLGRLAKAGWMLLSLTMPIWWVCLLAGLGFIVDPLAYYVFLHEREDRLMLLVFTAHWHPLALHALGGWLRRAPRPAAT